MLNEKLKSIQDNLDKYIVYDKLPPLTGDDVENWVLDIEVCPTDNTNTKVLVYSIAIMDCSNNYICYKYNDIKPFFIELLRKYGNKEVQASAGTASCWAPMKAA